MALDDDDPNVKHFKTTIGRGGKGNMSKAVKRGLLVRAQRNTDHDFGIDLSKVGGRGVGRNHWLKRMEQGAEYEVAMLRYNEYLLRQKAEAQAKLFSYKGKKMNRHEMMHHIVMLTTLGWSLPKILGDFCDKRNILPLPQEVNNWMSLHPDFKEQLELATHYRAELLNDIGVDAVMNAGRDSEEGATRDEINHAKLVKDTLVEQAAFLHEKFQTKTRQQVEDITERRTPEQIRAQISAMLEANPALRDQFKQQQQSVGISEKADDAEVIE